MSPKLKNIILLVITIILIILFTPFFGNLYEKIIGREITTWFLGPENPEYFEGFFMSYAFFITLIITLFVNKKKYNILGIFLGLLLLFYLFIGAWEGLIINLGTIILVWLVAQIILFIYKKLKK